MYLLILGLRLSDGGMLFPWPRVKMEEAKPSYVSRVKTSAYIPLSKASHMAKPIIGGMRKFSAPMEGSRRD